MTLQNSIDPQLGRLHELAQKACDPLELTVLDVKVGQQGKRRTVEICLFKKEGFIGLEECEKVSRDFEALIESPDYQDGADVALLLSGSYLLEVVSPGIERELKSSREFEIFAGHKVKVKAREKFGAYGVDFIATLLGADENQIKLASLVAFDPNQSSAKKANGKSKNQKKSQADPDSAPALADETPASDVVLIELEKLLRVNLYADDLKGN